MRINGKSAIGDHGDGLVWCQECHAQDGIFRIVRFAVILCAQLASCAQVLSAGLLGSSKLTANLTGYPHNLTVLRTGSLSRYWGGPQKGAVPALDSPV